MKEWPGATGYQLELNQGCGTMFFSTISSPWGLWVSSWKVYKKKIESIAAVKCCSLKLNKIVNDIIFIIYA